MGFWPTGPITVFSAAVVWAIAAGFLISGSRDQKLIGAAFLVSWTGARASTATLDPFWTVAAATIAAALCMSGFTLASRAIAMLYGVRLVLLSGLGFGLWDWFLLWELNLVFLYLQILIAVGTIDGLRISRGDMGAPGADRRAYRAVDLSQARGHFKRPR